MNEIDWLKSLDRDRADDAGEIDVVNSVMRDIRARQIEPADSLTWPAIVATLAGGVAAIITIQLMVTDPFAGFLDAFNLVLQ